MYQPWIGQRYEVTRLMILGESAYSWWEADEQRHPSAQHSSEMVQWTIDNFPNCGQFLALVSRALANEERPTKDRLQSVWDRVAFTNYVSTTVGDGPRTRPTPEMWALAKAEFLSDLAMKLKPIPKRLVVLGKTMWSQMPDAPIFMSDDVQGYSLVDGVVMCWAVDHPAHSLSWQKLASLIHFTYEAELRD